MRLQKQISLINELKLKDLNTGMAKIKVLRLFLLSLLRWLAFLEFSLDIRYLRGAIIKTIIRLFVLLLAVTVKAEMDKVEETAQLAVYVGVGE